MTPKLHPIREGHLEAGHDSHCQYQRRGQGRGRLLGQGETLLYCALIGYIHYEAPVEEQNFSTLIELHQCGEDWEDKRFKSRDLMFDELESRNPSTLPSANIKYKLAAGKPQNLS